ncbi:unnamed protein product [Amaranthus hypochondriacus]
MNCPEVEPYLRRFTSQLRSAVPPSMSRDQFDALLEEQFPIFFKHYAFAGHLDYAPNGQILKDMAQGPLKYAKTYNICSVNGYKFHTSKHATRKAVDNSGVCVKAADDSEDGDAFYGRLEESDSIQMSLV